MVLKFQLMLTLRQVLHCEVALKQKLVTQRSAFLFKTIIKFSYIS